MMTYYLKITAHAKQKGPNEFSLENKMLRIMTMVFCSVKSNVEERMSLSPGATKGAVPSNMRKKYHSRFQPKVKEML